MNRLNPRLQHFTAWCMHQLQAAWLQEDIEEMCKHCEKPLIFPLSNPSSKAEITADKAYEWSHGKCVYASGEACCVHISEERASKSFKCPRVQRYRSVWPSCCCVGPS